MSMLLFISITLFIFMIKNFTLPSLKKLIASESISANGYKVQIGCKLAWPDSRVFLACSYTPGKSGSPKVELKISISINDVEAMTIAAAGAALTIATDGMDLPVILAALGDEAAGVIWAISKMLTVAAA